VQKNYLLIFMTKTYKRKNRKTLGKRKKGGETDDEVRNRRKEEIQDKIISAIEKGLYLSPNNVGDIVNQNLDILKLNEEYNDKMNYECAEEDGVTFGGKRRRKNKKNKTLRKKH
jgi:hypothetical protein